jgi:hypothetical protein
VVIDLNDQAYAQLRCEKSLEIIPRAGNLFEEAGALERVAELAREWFRSHLTGHSGVMYADHGVVNGFNH